MHKGTGKNQWNQAFLLNLDIQAVISDTIKARKESSPTQNMINLFR